MDVQRLAIAGVAIALVAILLYYHPSVQDNGRVTVIISMDYGKQTLLVKETRSGISALEALKHIANVSTAYGGGFVKGINGIYSDPSQKKDWFYYINGYLANVGASKYILRDGDVMRWDYHKWGEEPFVTAELMDFPHMFTKGYGGNVKDTVILYDYKYKKEAENIGKFLTQKGAYVKIFEAKRYDGNYNKNIILIGTESKIFWKINNNTEVDLPYRVKGEGIVDWQGRFSRGAFAEILQSPLNPKGNWACENVMLIIAGSDEYLDDCVDALLKHHDSFWIYRGPTNET